MGSIPVGGAKKIRWALCPSDLFRMQFCDRARKAARLCRRTRIRYSRDMTEACARLGSDSRWGCQTEELRSSLCEKSLAKTQVIFLFVVCFRIEPAKPNPSCHPERKRRGMRYDFSLQKEKPLESKFLQSNRVSDEQQKPKPACRLRGLRRV